MSIFRYDSPLGKGLNRITDLVILNLFTLLASIPLITIGPGICALHYVLIKLIKDEEVSLRADYFKAFKRELKQGIITWILMLPVFGILWLDMRIVKTMEGNASSVGQIIMISCIALALMILQYVFPIQARYEGGIKETLGKAVRLSFGAFPRSVCMIIAQLLPLGGFMLFSVYFTPIYILMGISGPAYLVAKLYNPLFKEEDDNEY